MKASYLTSSSFSAATAAPSLPSHSDSLLARSLLLSNCTSPLNAADSGPSLASYPSPSSTLRPAFPKLTPTTQETADTPALYVQQQTRVTHGIRIRGPLDERMTTNRRCGTRGSRATRHQTTPTAAHRRHHHHHHLSAFTRRPSCPPRRRPRRPSCACARAWRGPRPPRARPLYIIVSCKKSVQFRNNRIIKILQ